MRNRKSSRKRIYQQIRSFITRNYITICNLNRSTSTDNWVGIVRVYGICNRHDVEIVPLKMLFFKTASFTCKRWALTIDLSMSLHTENVSVFVWLCRRTYLWYFIVFCGNKIEKRPAGSIMVFLRKVCACQWHNGIYSTVHITHTKFQWKFWKCFLWRHIRNISYTFLMTAKPWCHRPNIYDFVYCAKWCKVMIDSSGRVNCRLLWLKSHKFVWIYCVQYNFVFENVDKNWKELKNTYCTYCINYGKLHTVIGSRLFYFSANFRCAFTACYLFLSKTQKPLFCPISPVVV